MKQIFILVLLINFFFGQEKHREKSFGNKILNDFSAQSSALTSSKNTFTILGTIGFVGLVSIGDAYFSERALNWGQTNNIKKSADFFSEFGSSYILIGSGIYSVYSFLGEDDYLKENSNILIETVITSSTWNIIEKNLFGRERPYHAHGAGRERAEWFSINNLGASNAADFWSMPSGHSNLSFALATVVAERSKETDFYGYLAYTLAAGVGVARMVEDKHWISDVVAGAILGHFAAKQVLNNYEKDNRTNDNDISYKLNYMAIVTKEKQAIMLNYSF
jgi:hypothetical protein